jgi:YidC/Oxa1 family membrane protein insertase
MEKKLLLAIVLSFLLLLVWQLVLGPKPKPSPGLTPITTTVPPPKPIEEKPLSNSAPAKDSKKESKVLNINKIEAYHEKHLKISTSLYTADWTNKGGLLTSWSLRKHKNDKNEDLELVSESAAEMKIYPFSLLDVDENPDPMKGLNHETVLSNPFNSRLYRITIKSRGVVPDLNDKAEPVEVPDGQSEDVIFEYALGDELVIRKEYSFFGGKYDFGINIQILRNGQPVEPWLLWGPGLRSAGTDEFSRTGASRGMTVMIGTATPKIDERRYDPIKSVANYVSWAAYDDNYFAAIFVPAAAAGKAVFLKEDSANRLPSFYVAVANPGKAFIGPKEFEVLDKFGQNTKKIVQFGFFGFIAEILFVTLKFIHKFIPNWGFAIIVLTFIIKILFFPLTYSSTKSMSKMAELQPKIKALRAKYKKSKTDIAQRRQMNEDMMKLYKENGVNPAGGCLPMLLQIPVFFGLFSLLRAAIELRQSPWIFWIKDLSVKDPLYITPLLMGATQFISQKMTPTSADPSQARMMLIMPVVMTIFFMSFQSGLVLYWLTSNVLQIGQQYIMNRMMAKKKVESHGKRRKA